MLWLQLIHCDLPKLVKQKYGTELRSCTLASIKPEISQALNTLLDELHTVDEGRINRMSGYHNNHTSKFPRQQRTQHQSYKHTLDNTRPKPTCPICKQANRTRYDHYLSSCSYLPKGDKKFLSRARVVQSLEEQQLEYYPDEEISHYKPGEEHYDYYESPSKNLPIISMLA